MWAIEGRRSTKLIHHRAAVQQWTDGGPGDPAQAPQTPDVWKGEVGPPPTACAPRRLSRHRTSRSLSEKEAAWGLVASLNTTKIYIVVKNQRRTQRSSGW